MATTPYAAPPSNNLVPMASTSLPTVLPASNAVPQTVQLANSPATPIINQWWEVTGVLPSIAAVVAVVFTAISLHWNTSRQMALARKTTKDQIDLSKAQALESREHAALEAKKERLVATRKGIYEDIINDYRAVQQLIGALPFKDVQGKPEEIEPIGVMSASVNKLWIWGEVQTVLVVREFFAQVNELFHEAVQLAASIHQLNRSIADLSVNLTNLKALLDSARSKHDDGEINLNSSNASTHDALNPFKQLRDAQHLMAKEILSRETSLADLQQERDILQVDYFKSIASRQLTLTDHMNTMMAAVRTELELDGDISLLVQQSIEIGNRAQAVLNQHWPASA